MPRQSVLKKLADYFEISVEMLLNATPALWNAARESVANQDFAKLPIEQREAMLKTTKENAPGQEAEGYTEQQKEAIKFVMSLPDEQLRQFIKVGRAMYGDNKDD